MSYPSRQITGQVYTARGDVVVAGQVTAWLLPHGFLVPDTAGNAWYRIQGKTQAQINTTGIQSFYLTSLDSMIGNESAFVSYFVRFDLTEPHQDCWVEYWRITNANSGALPITEITPLRSYGY